MELAQRAGLRDVWVERHFPYRLVLSAAQRECAVAGLEIAMSQGRVSVRIRSLQALGDRQNRSSSDWVDCE